MLQNIATRFIMLSPEGNTFSNILLLMCIVRAICISHTRSTIDYLFCLREFMEIRREYKLCSYKLKKQNKRISQIESLMS